MSKNAEKRWQVALERERSQLRNRCKAWKLRTISDEPSFKFTLNRSPDKTIERFLIENFLIGGGVKSILIVGYPNYSSAQSDIEYWKNRIRRRIRGF